MTAHRDKTRAGIENETDAATIDQAGYQKHAVITGEYRHPVP